MGPLKRYVLLETPDAILAAGVLYALHLWAGLAAELAWGLLAFWVVAHVALYPFVRKSYESTPSEHIGPERLVGARGVATRPLDPTGMVRVESELWGAELHVDDEGQLLPEGAVVVVHEVRGLTLIVRRD
jgi:membrane protein implicated in regulation of membrane protease activity